jgi:predicted amidophosphoribosyltransferase
LKNRFYSLDWDIIDLIFPPTCGGRKKPGVRWCEICRHQTKEIQLPICEICGQTIPTGNLYYPCSKSRLLIKAVRSWVEFDGPIRNALHDLKYRKNIGLGISLANHLVELFLKYNWAFDLVTPVPLGEERQNQRGYNQSDLLAKPLAYTL